MDYGYVIALVLTTVVLLVRVTLWRKDPGSRPVTVVTGLVVVAIITHHPRVLDERWLFDHAPSWLHLANVTNVVGELVALAIAGYMGVKVARAWLADRLIPFIVGTTGAMMLALLVLWQISDASRIPTRNLSDLGGLARVYSVLASIGLILAGVAVCASVTLIRNAPLGLRLVLAPMAVAAAAAAFVGALHLVEVLSHTDLPYSDPALSGPAAKIGIACFAVSATLDYLVRRATANTRQSGTPVPN
ncbi:hypothetical protein [Nocardia sp. IFM 10818]